MSFDVFVVRVKDSKRSTVLEKSIRTLLNKEPVFVDAIQPSDLPCESLNPDHSHGSKKLSCREVATSLSHFRARVRASINDQEWSLILEEDASLKINLNDMEEVFAQFDNKKKSISIHLYPEQFGVLVPSRKKTLYRVVQVPDYAVAYLLNRKSLLNTLRNAGRVVNYVADWPSEILKSKWYATKNSLVIHPHDEESNKLSLIKKYREKRQQSLKNLPHRNLNRLSRRNLIYYLARALSKTYFGNNPIASENLRTIIVARKSN